MSLKKKIKNIKKKPVVNGIFAILVATTGWVFHKIIYSTFVLPLSHFSEYTQNWIIFLALILILMFFDYKWYKIILK